MSTSGLLKWSWIKPYKFWCLKEMTCNSHRCAALDLIKTHLRDAALELPTYQCCWIGSLKIKGNASYFQNKTKMYLLKYREKGSGSFILSGVIMQNLDVPPRRQKRGQRGAFCSLACGMGFLSAGKMGAWGGWSSLMALCTRHTDAAQSISSSLKCENKQVENNKETTGQLPIL